MLSPISKFRTQNSSGADAVRANPNKSRYAWGIVAQDRTDLIILATHSMDRRLLHVLFIAFLVARPVPAFFLSLRDGKKRWIHFEPTQRKPQLVGGRRTTEILAHERTGRREYLRFAGCTVFGSIIIPYFVGIPEADAAPPLTAGEADNVGARLNRKLRPKPPKVLRPKIDLDFAVLLMRSSYNALDELDCVAMDQFQRDFFLIRQAEYEPYTQLLGPGFVKQGDLTDPYYFDFISFAQYKAINREMTVDPAFVFEEKQPVEVEEGEPQKFVSRVIQRNPSITNELLPIEHSKRVARKILERFDNVFGGTRSGLPEYLERRPTSRELLAALDQLVKLFLLNGFAWDGSASLLSEDSNGKLQFCLTLNSPATIWSGRALQSERSSLQNDFMMKTAILVAQRYGYRVVASSLKFDGTKEMNYLNLV